MLPEKLLDLLLSCKPAFARRLEPAIDARKFSPRRRIFAPAELSVDLKRKLGEFSLSCLGPGFHTSQHVLEFFRGHEQSIAAEVLFSDSAARDQLAHQSAADRARPTKNENPHRPAPMWQRAHAA